MSDQPKDQKALAERFAHIAELETAESGPPVEQWDPPYLGELPLRIDSDGRWYYQGSRMTREALVRLFASILRLDEDGFYYLVTPVEKFRISVEDVPFVAHGVEVEGEGDERVIWLSTNADQTLALGERHPLFMREGSNSEEKVPYVVVRRNLLARVERNAFYHLVELAEERPINGSRYLGITSQGQFFSLGPAP